MGNKRNFQGVVCDDWVMGRKRWCGDAEFSNSIISLEANSTQPPPVAMRILAWNYQGLGNPRTVKDLLNTIQQKAPTLLFLSETKSCKRNLERL